MKSFNWQVINVYDSAVRWAVPIFFMLSGMLFLNPEKEISTKKIYSKNIFRLFIALVFWGLLYNSVSVFGKIATHENSRAIITEIIESVAKIPFGMPWYHLWFLYSLIGMYVLTPLFRIFSKNAQKKDFEYLLLLFAIFGTIIPILDKLLNSIDSRLHFTLKIVELTGYAGYFFAGYYFSTFSLQPRTKKLIIFAGLFSMMFTILASSFSSLYKNEPIAFFYSYFQITTMFEAYGIFILVKTICEKHSFSEKTQKNIWNISKLTFGIYLVHDFFNILFTKIGFATILVTPIVMIPLRSVIVFCLSYIITFIINKIPILKKII